MIKFGIVGMGIRGSLFADTIMQNPYSELVAVSEINEEGLAKAKDKYRASGYKDVEEMIQNEVLDALVISTPDFLHYKPVMLAAKKGIHIMVEKPFSTSIEETEEMYQAVKEAGIKCLIAFENRWNSPFVAVKEAIENGEIGNIVTMNARLNDTIFVPTQMLKWSKNSSPGWFLFPHATDIACWLNEKRPVQVFAVGTKKKLVSLGIDTYDSIQTIVTFEDQTHATFTTSWILPESMPLIYDFKYEIIGENGALYVDLADQMVRKAVTDYKHVHTLGTPINGLLTSAPSYMLNSFVDNIRLDTTPVATEEDGLLNTRLVHAIHKSIETGTVQPI
ncbi:Gfo/Idh/MocA family oxidoreductase [Bacillus sp. EB106-08-02-XG196]|uniref:Gfo/Idh/MocA family protein n=1 Tax=Bacillus sp. EB106-08-02-XG196 TaxID=2737049 RepID=UPI0015C4126B|nr:Gfo/Idh/MocA family oxidoreductase [Bacillus sp. EB106-08-02-XG196]NWQ41935.1 Gfo/Idh/MocA family oxidoreductase [Bacillus sp. EB106-08-02-XG196]